MLSEPSGHPGPCEADCSGDRSRRLGAVLLAAGQASRMGKGQSHKLLATFCGVPLVRRSAQTLIKAKISPVVAVTGHRHQEIEAALAGTGIMVQFNASYSSGLASSLSAGLSCEALGGCEGVLVMLADMPGISAEHVMQLADSFERSDGHVIVRAVNKGVRGNPIILPRATFHEVLNLQGDAGARTIIENCGLPIIDVEIGPAAHLDVDTPEALKAAGALLAEHRDG